MTDVQFKQTIYNLLTNLKSSEPLKQLFRSELNYNRINQPISLRGWNKTASEALAEDPLLFAAGGEGNNFHISPMEIQKRCDEAFDVEKVTKQFYENYKIIFTRLQQILFENSRDKVWAHDYALQSINRIMFLYFIQRKRWLGNNPDFIHHFWETYKNSQQPPDTFFDNWRERINNQLGIECFENRSRHSIRVGCGFC